MLIVCCCETKPNQTKQGAKLKLHKIIYSIVQ